MIKTTLFCSSFFICIENRIGNKTEKLPDYLFSVVNDFVEFLLIKHGNEDTHRAKFKFDWEGGLSKLKSDFTSAKLQHKALELR